METTHPVTVIRKIYKKAALLLIPAVRGAYHMISDGTYGFSDWMSGVWLDAAVLAAAVIFSILNWRSVKYSVSPGRIILKKGVLFKSERILPEKRITSVTCHRPLLFGMLGAESVYADTEGGSTKRSDMSIIIRSSRTRDFYTSPRSGKTYRPRVHEVLLLSLCVTDTPASAVYAFILMNRAGKILGRDIITEFISLAAGAARYAAAVVLAVEILGILRNFLYFSRFSVTRYGDSLYFENGFFSKTRSMCKTGAVNYIDRRQNLASAVLGLGMVFIQCTGYGKARKKEALLVPAAAERSAEACIKMLLPEFCGRTENCGAKAGAHCLRPAAVSFLRYVRTPVALCVPVIIACISVPHFAEVILLILTPPLALLAAVRATAFRRAGIFSEGCEISEKTEGCEKTEARIKSKDVMLTLCYYKGFSIHTVSFRASKISHVKIKQNIMSRNKNIYDVTVYTCGEGGHRHTVRGLDIDREDPQAYITSFPFLQGVFF